MKPLNNLLAVAALTLSGSFAAEAAVTFTLIDGDVKYTVWEGNDNPSSNGDWADFLTLTGYQLIGKYDVPDEEDPGGFSGASFTITGTPGSSGTWSADFGVNAVVIKGGPNFLLVEYNDAAPVFGDNWCTNSSCESLFGNGADMPTVPNGSGNGPAGLSHLSLYALERIPAIPEPASWLMMIMGFGLTVFASRRRSVQHPA